MIFIIGDDESILSLKPKFCIVEQETFIGTYEQMLTIREIHRFGTKLWLSKKTKNIKSFYYKKDENENGPRCILTSDYQYYVPRRIEHENPDNASKIVFAIKNFSPYHNNDKAILKELVISDNSIKLVPYKLEKCRKNEITSNGTKAHFVLPKTDTSVLIF